MQYCWDSEVRSGFVIEECKDANLVEWQNFVDGSAFSNIFQTKDWAMAVRKAGLGTLCIVARNRNGAVAGGMLSTYGEYRFFKLKVIPKITVWGGPLVYDVNDKRLIEDLFEFFDVKAKKLGALDSFVRTFFPLDSILVNRLNYKIEYDRLPCTVIVNLTMSADELWKVMAERGRRGIRKAIKKGVKVEEAKSIEDLSAYYQICASTSERLKIPLISFRLLKSLWESFYNKDNLKLFLATYQSKPIAGVIVVRWQDKMWGFHGGSLREHWHLNPNLLIHWHIMKWGIDHEVTSYDLMGIPCVKDKNHPKYGLYLFKTQFGGQIERHGEYVKHRFPFRSLLLTKGSWVLGRLRPAHEKKSDGIVSEACKSTKF